MSIKLTYAILSSAISLQDELVVIQYEILLVVSILLFNQSLTWPSATEEDFTSLSLVVSTVCQQNTGGFPKSVINVISENF